MKRGSGIGNTVLITLHAVEIFSRKDVGYHHLVSMGRLQLVMGPAVCSGTLALTFGCLLKLT